MGLVHLANNVFAMGSTGGVMMLEKVCLNCGGPVAEDAPLVKMGDTKGYLCGEKGNDCWSRLGEGAFRVVKDEEDLREAELFLDVLQPVS